MQGERAWAIVIAKNSSRCLPFLERKSLRRVGFCGLISLLILLCCRRRQLRQFMSGRSGLQNNAKVRDTLHVCLWMVSDTQTYVIGNPYRGLLVDEFPQAPVPLAVEHTIETKYYKADVMFLMITPEMLRSEYFPTLSGKSDAVILLDDLEVINTNADDTHTSINFLSLIDPPT